MFTAMFLLIMGAIASVVAFLAIRDEIKDHKHNVTARW